MLLEWIQGLTWMNRERKRIPDYKCCITYWVKIRILYPKGLLEDGFQLLEVVWCFSKKQLLVAKNWNWRHTQKSKNCTKMHSLTSCLDEFFPDPHGFQAKRRKTAEQSYASFMTDVSHLPKTLALFNGKSCFSLFGCIPNVDVNFNKLFCCNSRWQFGLVVMALHNTYWVQLVLKWVKIFIHVHAIFVFTCLPRPTLPGHRPWIGAVIYGYGRDHH